MWKVKVVLYLIFQGNLDLIIVTELIKKREKIIAAKVSKTLSMKGRGK
jgi:hypothetical protein